MSAKAAKDGAKAQTKASNQAIAEQRRQFDTMLQYLGPQYTDARLAQSHLMTLLGLYPDTNYKPPSAVPAPAQPATGNVPQARPQGGMFSRMVQEATGEPMQGVATNPDGSTAPAPYTPGKTQADLVSEIRNSVGFDTQLQTGMEAVDRAAAGTGSLMSGRRLMALNAEGQKTFGSFYDKYVANLSGIAGTGGPIASAIGQGAQAMGNNIAGLMSQRGQAQAQGTLNAAQAWGQAANDVAGAAGWWYGQRPMSGMSGAPGSHTSGNGWG